ncbi:MAG: 2Fe-2S iron-sulfur cluster-binding protein [Thermodesulfobacteriota bacterium]
MNRLSGFPTLRIDPSRAVPFTYQDRPLTGLAGDTLATALYANGIRVFSRSLKFHRPRGLYSLDFESANCLLEVNGLPNCRAEQVRLEPGLEARPQTDGSPRWDKFFFLDWLDRLMPAGFYYRYFHKPAFIWPLALPRIRQMAGHGRINLDWTGGRFENRFLNADVAVVGGGPAGLKAALAAAKTGLRVILLEARPWLGGYYDWRLASDGFGGSLHQRGLELARAADEMANLRVFTRTVLIGCYNDNLLTAVQRGGPEDDFEERYLEIRAASVVAATGCIERPLVFEHNDRPGVMQAGCAWRLARTWGLLPGKKAVVCGGHDFTLEAALDLADLGVRILAVADCRPRGWDEELAAAVKSRGIEFLPGQSLTKALGSPVVRGVDINGRRLPCDLVLASAGLAPAPGPLQLLPVPAQWDEKAGYFLPRDLPPRLHPAGRLLGHHRPLVVETSGTLAGLQAAADRGAIQKSQIIQAQEELAELTRTPGTNSIRLAPAGAGRKSFVCFDEDTTLKNLEEAWAMGFQSPEPAKRFTAAGTGPSQSGVPGVNLPLWLADRGGVENGRIAPTTVRDPLVPTLLATLAGPSHPLIKLTPLADSQAALGAVFRRVAPWERARYFSEDFSAREEIANVRQNVGLIDVSTLGKFRIFGPDALSALERVYVGDLSQVRPGRLKYSAMCNEDANLIDDGVITRLGENDYYFTTSTGRAGDTISWLRYHARHEKWEFHLVNLTDALGAVNLAGPRSREVLSRVTEEDVSNEAFPYLGFREITLTGGVKAKVLRVGFVGELAFELHVPASLTQYVWDLLWDAGADLGIRPFGLEAQNVLRLEKGHVIIGVETEIRTTLHDVGLGFLWSRSKRGVVGGPALAMTEKQPGRLKLVGFKTVNPAETPQDGSIVVDREIRGHVCTARYSQTLAASIGLALVEEPLVRPGGPLEFYDDRGRRIEARITPAPFYDPEGRRLRM